jgi:AcrR family transcriptional regulator
MNDTRSQDSEPRSAEVRSDSGAATREALLEAARAAFGRAGFDGASVRAITTDAGANLGAITYHFGSKRGLYDAVLQAGLRPLADRVRSAAATEGSALDRVVCVVEAYFEHLMLHPDLPHLLLQEIAAGKHPPDIVVEIVGELKEALAALQRVGERDGSVRPGHPVLTALSVISQPVYLTLVAPMLRVVAGVDLTDRATHEAAVSHATDFVRRALEPRTEMSA